MAAKQFGLSCHSFVLEIGSNDGYLLRNFVECGIPCLGIEPSSQRCPCGRSNRSADAHRLLRRSVGSGTGGER